MAASLNKVFLMGNLTRDPELRYIPSGQAVASFSVAINRTYNSQSGEKKEEVSFVRVVVWRRLAEVCNEYLKKGSPVLVEGRLQSRSWEAQDGSKRSTLEVIADNIQFLPRAGARPAEADAVPSMDVDNSIFEEPSGTPSKDSKPNIKITDKELAPDEEIPF